MTAGHDSQPGSPQPAQQRGRVSGAFIVSFALAYTGVWLALLTPVLVTISVRVRQLAPANAADDLSLVLAVGAMFALFGNPLFGRLSDHTVSRYGMRRPWLVGGMLCGSGALLLVAMAPNVGIVLIGWCLAQLAFNAVLAAIVAVLPDQVPSEQRGTVSGVLAMCLPVGQALGTLLVGTVAGSTVLSFLLPALIGTALVFAFAWSLPDRTLRHAHRPPLGWRELLQAFWFDPRRHPDFAWVCLSRLLLVMGTAFITTYQPFYLIEKLGYALSEVPSLVSTAIGLQATMIVLVSLISGKLSDLLQRRKLFAILGGVTYAVGLCFIAAAETYGGFLLGMATTGIGHGIYFAVDLALVTEVLPNRDTDAAKDLGLLNVANALPQAAAPALGPLILLLAGGNYTWLYVVAAGIALLSSVTILPLRSAR